MTGEQAILALDRIQSVVHDLKTPLTVIGVLEQELERAPDMPLWALRYLEKLRWSYARTAELFLTLTDVERLTGSAVRPRLKVCNVVKLIEDAALSMSAIAERANVDIVFETSEEELFSRIDKTLLERVILNLVSNALKFTSAGGEVCVDLYYDGETLYVTVSDTGVGFYDYELENPFARLRPGHGAMNPKGTGLGLAGTRDMAEALGGTLTCANRIGGGARITLALPLDASFEQMTLDSIEADSFEAEDNLMTRYNLLF